MINAACIAQPECQFGHLSISFFNTRAMPKHKNTTLHQAEMDCAKHSMLLKQFLLSFCWAAGQRIRLNYLLRRRQVWCTLFNEFNATKLITCWCSIHLNTYLRKGHLKCMDWRTSALILDPVVNSRHVLKGWRASSPPSHWKYFCAGHGGTFYLQQSNFSCSDCFGHWISSSQIIHVVLVVSVWKSKSLIDLLGQWNRHASLKHTSMVWNQESGAWAVRDAANIFLAAPQLNCMYCRFYFVVLSLSYLSSHFWLFPSNYFMKEVDSWVGSAELKGGSCRNARFGILWNLQEGSRTMEDPSVQK